MNNGIVITSEAEYLEVVSELKASLKVLEDIFLRQKSNVEKINETNVWSGASSKALYSKYKLLNNNYDQISYSIDLYIKFLEKTLEDYKLLIKEQEKNIDAMESSLDVNS